MYFSERPIDCAEGDKLITKMKICQYGRTCEKGTTVAVSAITESDVLIRADSGSFVVPKFHFRDVLQKVS